MPTPLSDRKRDEIDTCLSVSVIGLEHNTSSQVQSIHSSRVFIFFFVLADELLQLEPPLIAHLPLPTFPCLVSIPASVHIQSIGAPSARRPSVTTPT